MIPKKTALDYSEEIKKIKEKKQFGKLEEAIKNIEVGNINGGYSISSDVTVTAGNWQDVQSSPSMYSTDMSSVVASSQFPQYVTYGGGTMSVPPPGTTGVPWGTTSAPNDFSWAQPTPEVVIPEEKILELTERITQVIMSKFVPCKTCGALLPDDNRFLMDHHQQHAETDEEISQLKSRLRRLQKEVDHDQKVH